MNKKKGVPLYKKVLICLMAMVMVIMCAMVPSLAVTQVNILKPGIICSLPMTAQVSYFRLAVDDYIEDIDTTSRYDYYTDEYGAVAFESYDKKDHIEYNGYDISYMPDYVDGYTVQYNGDDIVFDTIDDAKTFIDDLK